MSLCLSEQLYSIPGCAPAQNEATAPVAVIVDYLKTQLFIDVANLLELVIFVNKCGKTFELRIIHNDNL